MDPFDNFFSKDPFNIFQDNDPMGNAGKDPFPSLLEDMAHFQDLSKDIQAQMQAFKTGDLHDTKKSILEMKSHIDSDNLPNGMGGFSVSFYSNNNGKESSFTKSGSLEDLAKFTAGDINPKFTGIHQIILPLNAVPPKDGVFRALSDGPEFKSAGFFGNSENDGTVENINQEQNLVVLEVLMWKLVCLLFMTLAIVAIALSYKKQRMLARRVERCRARERAAAGTGPRSRTSPSNENTILVKTINYDVNPPKYEQVIDYADICILDKEELKNREVQGNDSSDDSEGPPRYESDNEVSSKENGGK